MAWIRNRPLGLVYRDKAKSFPGYTLFSPVRGHHADLLDAEGRIVHQWYHPEGTPHVKLLPNGHLLVQTLPPESGEGQQEIGGCAAAMIELDQDSSVVWEYRDPYQHHDYQRLANGNTLLSRWDKIPSDFAARIQGGHIAKEDPDWMWGDVIREIAPDGSTVREWRSWEHLAPEHHVKCPLESRKEWTHLNSIEFTPEGDWLLSFRLSSTVCIVDAVSGDVRWRWGADVLSHQHCATYLEGDKILIFDNGCHRKEAPSFSQVVEVDRKTKNIEWSYKAEPILAFYSFMISGCERLPNLNTLITEGATGRIFEVTPEGETVWEYVSPWTCVSPRFGPTNAVFRGYRIPEDDVRLEGLRLSPVPYDELNDRIASYEVLGEDDEKSPTPKKKARRSQKNAPKPKRRATRAEGK